MESLQLALPIMLIHFIAVMLPGPNFLIVTRNSLKTSRLVGLATAVGISLGAAIWIISGLVGFTILIRESAMAIRLIRLIGGGYLAYLGLRGLFDLLTKPRQPEPAPKVPIAAQARAWPGFRMGLLTTMTNPKTALYILAIFTSVVTPTTPAPVKTIVGISLPLISLSWYTFVALLFSADRPRRFYLKAEGLINFLFAGLLLYLAGVLLLGI